MAAENRTAVPVFIEESGTGQPDFLRIGAATEMKIYLIRHGRTEANEQHLYCGSTDLPHEVDPRFREIDFGVFEMHGYEELKDRPDYQAWITGDNERNIPPRGESGIQMKRRVLEALADLRDDTCIITHGGVIAAIMEHLFPDEGMNRYQWQPKPGGGYAISDDMYYSKL